MITKEEILKVAKHCATYDCGNCPFFYSGTECEPAFAEYILANEPTADVEKVKHGKWLKPSNSPIDNRQWICSECKGLIETAYHCEHCYYNYCPNCGTRMEGDSNDG